MKAEQLQKYDVVRQISSSSSNVSIDHQVLSSYGTIEAAFRKQQRGFKKGNVFIKEASPVHSFEWFR